MSKDSGHSTRLTNVYGLPSDCAVSTRNVGVLASSGLKTSLEYVAFIVEFGVLGDLFTKMEYHSSVS